MTGIGGDDPNFSKTNKQTKKTPKRPCSMSITAIGRASNTSDFYKTLSPFDGIFDNSFISFMLGKRKKKEEERKDLYFQQRMLLLTPLLYFVILSP